MSLREAANRATLYAPGGSRARRFPVQLRLSTRTVDGVIVIDSEGRLVFGEESASLRDTVKNMISQNNHIVLNLGGVNYIDSGGLGTLVALYTTARNAGGAIKLAALTKRVGDLLQVTKLLTVFEVFDSVDEAVKSFRKGVAA
jgi:anti-sigma B factor antagonist